MSTTNPLVKRPLQVLHVCVLLGIDEFIREQHGQIVDEELHSVNRNQPNQMDYFTYTLKQYFKEIGHDESRTYAHLAAASER